VSDREFDELTERIQELDRARRELAQALDASRISAVEGDRWPRPLDRPRRIDRRPFLLCVSAVVVAAAFMTRQWTAAPEAAPQESAALSPLSVAPALPAAAANPPSPEAVVSTPAVAPAAVSATTTRPPLVVHIRVVRPCSVRIVVDDVPLEWRAVRPGDEIISRPTRELTIETDDAGALAARVNGVVTQLGTHGGPSKTRFAR
jgi:hypothetical protein